MLRAFLDGAVFGATTGVGDARAVLLHGWRRTHEDFDGVAGELAARGVGAVALDLPGFGATPPPTEPTGARGYAAALVPLLDELASAAGPVVLVGHSFGGRVATCLAAQRPEVVGGLVLTGVPLIRSATPAVPSLRYRAVRTAARWHLISEATLEAARHRHGSEDYRAATGTVRAVLVATVAESYEAELAAIRCAVSLVWGSDDRTVTPAVAEQAAALLAAPKLTVLDGVGHLVPTERPRALADAAASLLEGAR